MARKFGRRPEETGAGYAASPSGEMGPWTRADKAEFHHAGREAQEWFLRLDASDVARMEYAQKLSFWVQTALKWAWRGWWAFTIGLSGAVAAGDNLQKLPATISGVISAIRGLF